MDVTSITPTPHALKALSHPVRLRMLGLLRREGPATATTLAVRLGLNSGATSYHLRQLAQHGFVIDDVERGNARDRWWRAAHQSTRTGREAPHDEAGKEVLDAYLQTVAVVMTETLQRAIEERSVLPDDWRDASTYSDWVLRLTPQRARAFVELLEQTMDDAQSGDQSGDGTEEGAAEFVIQLHAFPRPGTVETGGGGEER